MSQTFDKNYENWDVEGDDLATVLQEMALFVAEYLAADPVPYRVTVRITSDGAHPRGGVAGDLTIRSRKPDILL